MLPESGFWMAANWTYIENKATTSQFAHMTSSSIFSDVDVFPLTSLVTGPIFMYPNIMTGS